MYHFDVSQSFCSLIFEIFFSGIWKSNRNFCFFPSFLFLDSCYVSIESQFEIASRIYSSWMERGEIFLCAHSRDLLEHSRWFLISWIILKTLKMEPNLDWSKRMEFYGTCLRNIIAFFYYFFSTFCLQKRKIKKK